MLATQHAKGGNLGAVVKKENISPYSAKLQKYIYIYAQPYRLT